ncbi:DUF4375 domain-containing protein [Adhaeribacter swui]|uniref:DUF4375 domain-containing protein n=1 Tax=Adhaeribacter swui TaxID=2086471 RepID=A0A7G7G921_9BACT|nr:DUF4375 domain-containing protein [Adhaeribacter swui]QNF33655.1 DUF4375 domain-containing protein [Adhaeribacter swui]
MDKKRRQELKKEYKQEQKKSDPVLMFLSELDQKIHQITNINTQQINKWADEELEQNIVYYVYNRFKEAGKPPKGKNLMEWERSVLQTLPTGVQAVFATHLFESDLSLNGSYWDFFYQNNGAFAVDTLNGYRLMDNRKMVEVLEQCLGTYLKMRKRGEIEEFMGVPHNWNIAEEYFITKNTKDFDDLDKEYDAERLKLAAYLKQKKIQFIRENKGLFITEN